MRASLSQTPSWICSCCKILLRCATPPVSFQARHELSRRRFEDLVATASVGPCSTLDNSRRGATWGYDLSEPDNNAILITNCEPLKAEALHLGDRTSDALEAINETETLIEGVENRYWCAELHRLRGVFLAALGAHETQIEASFREAIGTAKQQKSVSLEKRAEATYAEYRRQRANETGGRGFRLPL
jgi:hypothetical protein